MEILLNIIGSYDILGHCIQGILFVHYLQKIYSLTIMTGTFAIDFALIYFIGLIIGRLGAFLDKILIKLGDTKIKYFKYMADVENEDKMIQTLKTNKNMLRNFMATILIILVIETFSFVSNIRHIEIDIIKRVVALVVLLVIFDFSYKRVNNYISKRIFRVVTKNNENCALIETEVIMQKYTICPYCGNKNCIDIVGMKNDICYKCGAWYKVSERKENKCTDKN